MKKKCLSVAAIVFLFILVLVPVVISENVRADDEGPVITVTTPKADSIISNSTPQIVIGYSDPDGIDVTSVVLIVDDVDVSDWDETTVSATNMTYRTPSILEMDEGQHNVSIQVADGLGNIAYLEWSFTIDKSVKDDGGLTEGLISQIIFLAIIGSFLAMAGLALYVLYLQRFRRFTFRKHFIRNPGMRKRIAIVYIPILCAVMGYLIATYVLMVFDDGDPFVENYIFIVVLVAGVLPFAISARRDLKRSNNYERAFAQFLFELADSIRGGVDPAKAVIEHSKTDRSILKDNLKVASDGIRIGKPFDEVLDQMVQTIDSDLIKRYASLVGESSRMGGDISIVIHRAAQDMDELIKIEEDRRRQLMMQATTIYIGFGVIMVIVYLLVNLYPSLGSMSLGSFSTGISDSGSGVSSTSSGGMGFDTLKNRFYQVSISVGLSCGCLIGALTEGKVRYGLIHALILAIVTTVFFAFMVFPI